MKPRIIRVFAWTKQVSDQAQTILTDERARKRQPVNLEFEFGTFLDDQDRANVEAEADRWNSPGTRTNSDWEKFESWYDKNIRLISQRILKPSSTDMESTVFLIDDVPDRVVPLICFIWKQYIESFTHCLEGFPVTPPCHLAILRESSRSQFSKGCAEPEILFEQLKKIRTFNLDAPILLEGPTGTGKSFFAEFLHRMTAKKKSDFVRVNLAELSEDTNAFISRIVGHTAGSYTGATKQRDGVLQAYKDGTVFFDELDGLLVTNQIRLLTYIDDTKGDGQLHAARLGESKPEPFKRCNMIFATNRPVHEALQTEKLRPDFLHRFRETVEFQSLQKIFKKGGEHRDALILTYICFFLMKLRPSVEEEPEWFWSMPFRRNTWNTKTFEKMREFHWSGNFRTIEKYCRHLLAVQAFNPAKDFNLKEDWQVWADAQYDDAKVGYGNQLSATADGNKIPLPRKTSGLPTEIIELYKSVLKTAFDLAKGKDGKVNQALAAKNLGIDTRTLKKKKEEFGF